MRPPLTKISLGTTRNSGTCGRQRLEEGVRRVGVRHAGGALGEASEVWRRRSELRGHGREGIHRHLALLQQAAVLRVWGNDSRVLECCSAHAGR